MKKFLFILLVIITQLTATSQIKWAGARSSFYGIDPFPEDSSWTIIGRNIEKVSGASEAVHIWILGHIDAIGNCVLEFPQPDFVTTVPPNIKFIPEDLTVWGYTFNDHTKTLDYFDKQGIKVFLQVEPGLADIPALMDILHKQYGHHESVIGFGVDVEWYQVENDDWPNGTTIKGDTIHWNPVTDSAAQHWESTMLTYNSEYQLFLKHWLSGIMCPTYRGNIMFINDSQGFDWFNPPIHAMYDEFLLWSNIFAPAPVGFQVGYPNDTTWWPELDEPVGDLADSLITALNNDGLSLDVGYFWVDFTLYKPSVEYLWVNENYLPVIESPMASRSLQIAIDYNSKTLWFSKPITSFKLFTATGRTIMEQTDIEAKSITISDIAKGIYIIEVTQLGNRTASSMLTIQ